METIKTTTSRSQRSRSMALTRMAAGLFAGS